MALLRQETAARRIVTLLVLHDLNIALHHADRALVVRDGRLLANGTPEAVITPQVLADAYGVAARVERCSIGRPQVLVDGLHRPPDGRPS